MDRLFVYRLETERGRIKGDSFAAIQVHPSGRFAFGSNRGNESLAAFRMDADTARIRSIGQTPATGRLDRAGQEITVPQPVSMRNPFRP